MVKVYIWLPRLPMVGHASLTICRPRPEQDVHVSWWPSGNELSSRGIKHTLKGDELEEERPADLCVEIPFGLDERAMIDWWQALLARRANFGMFTFNCAGVVYGCLRAGGGPEWSSGGEWWAPWWTPIQVHHYASQLKRYFVRRALPGLSEPTWQSTINCHRR